MSTSFETTGKVKHAFDTEEVGANAFKKRLIIVTVQDGQYSNDYGFEALGDKVGVFDGVSEGDEVTVHWNIPRLREWKGKWWASHLNAWKLEKLSASTEQAAPPPADFDSNEFEDDSDQIPF